LILTDDLVTFFSFSFPPRLLEGAEEGEADDQGDDDEQPDKPRKKKHASRSGNTLAKDFSSLTLEQFNLEFNVDPLFKKTSADFDEGGARGLLLNHLNVDAEGKIIFDAGDARDEGDEDEEEEEEEQEAKAKGRMKLRSRNVGYDDEEEDDEQTTEKLDRKAKNASRKTEVDPKKLDIQRLRCK
jgi:condensin complex subunit 2